jgi:hypothetical protein
VDAAVMLPFAANAVRLQLHALAYNLANFTWSAARPANRPASHPFLQEQTSPSARPRLQRKESFGVFGQSAVFVVQERPD